MSTLPYDPPDIQQFAREVFRLNSDVDVTIDRPRDPAGKWFIDVNVVDRGCVGWSPFTRRTVTGWHRVICWQARHGFGFYADDEPTYGEKPIETIVNAKDAAVRALRP